MSEKRFSELQPALALTDADIVALTHSVDGQLTSCKMTLGELKAWLSPVPHIVKRGERLDALTAKPGTYLFDVGSELVNVPSTKVLKATTVVLIVYETGQKAMLSLIGQLNQVTRLAAAQFYLAPASNTYGGASWMWLANDGGDASSLASGYFTVQSLDGLSTTLDGEA